jgi:hypothetical protein
LFRNVTAAPLTLCDGSTVNKEDCVAVDLIEPANDYIGETFCILPNKAFRWYFLSEHRPNEVTMLKIFDSDQKCLAKCGLNCP